MNLAYAPFWYKLQQYSLLMRLNRPVGIALLLWPTLIALWLAGDGHPEPRIVLIFGLGVIVMRSAGCVINDFADRHFDGHVERTKTRPLVQGTVSAAEALALFFILLLVAFGLACQLDRQTLWLSVGGAFLAASYPFLKRITHFPQVGLGAAFGWAIPMAYSAQAHHLPLSCWLLYIATLLWAVAYDTLYAMVDREDDERIGVKSTAIWLGRYDKWGVGICHLSVLSLYVLIGQRVGLGFYFYTGIAVAFFLVLYQQWLIRRPISANYFQAFLNNQWFGAVLFAGTMLDFLIA